MYRTLLDDSLSKASLKYNLYLRALCQICTVNHGVFTVHLYVDVEYTEGRYHEDLTNVILLFYSLYFTFFIEK